MSNSESKRPKRKLLVNLVFGFICLSLLFFLYLAPEETTSRLPEDEIHQKYHKIASKKEADKLCVSCHAEDQDMPLPDDHPPPYRCLFCHKRNQ